MQPSLPPFAGDGSLRATLAPSVSVRTFGAELIVLDAASGNYFALNEVGSEFVGALQEGKSVEECARLLHERFDVAWPDLCSDLLQLSSELLSRSLIIPRATSSATLEASS